MGKIVTIETRILLSILAFILVFTFAYNWGKIVGAATPCSLYGNGENALVIEGEHRLIEPWDGKEVWGAEGSNQR